MKMLDWRRFAKREEEEEVEAKSGFVCLQIVWAESIGRNCISGTGTRRAHSCSVCRRAIYSTVPIIETESFERVELRL